MKALRALVVVVMIGLAGCGDDDDTAPPLALAVETTVEFDPGVEPVALASLDGGDLLVGERRTGVVRVVSPQGDLSEPVAQVDVAAAEGDQRGLLGLAADGEQIYAAWTRASDEHIAVAEITDGTERLVWLGPASSQRANGGHLEVLPDGRLLLGIGDLQEPDRVEDPDTPHGKLLALDPAGTPEQTPVALSAGWNNPYAFVVTGNGEIWVADNAPGDAPERLDAATETQHAPTCLASAPPPRSSSSSPASSASAATSTACSQSSTSATISPHSTVRPQRSVEPAPPPSTTTASPSPTANASTS